ncbi:MAG: hypothetical protein U0800_05610 [Isosphaeraceae bacterium]
MIPHPARIALSFFAIGCTGAIPDDLPIVYDLTRPEQAKSWRADHDIARINPAVDGLEVMISGPDPYFSGPPRDFPEGKSLLLKARVAADRGGQWQVFYFNRGGPDEKRSVRFETGGGGAWQDVVIPIPPLGRGTRFRIDPPGTEGTAKVARLEFVELVEIQVPAWKPPSRVEPSPNDLEIRSGPLALQHSQGQWGAFRVSASGREVAVGNNQPLLGYRTGKKTTWIEPTSAKTTREGRSILVSARFHDPDGAAWSLNRAFRPAQDGSIEVVTELSADRDRDLVFAPMLMIHPGLGTHGPRKGQGLFAGVEYLDDEPSRSEADLEGPEANRLVPIARKITFPLMAVQAEGLYVGLIWEASPNLAALFDSTDRTFGSNSHAIGLIAPGADGTRRMDGSLLPIEPTTLRANRPIRSRAWLIGGDGDSIIPAVRQYVDLRGLPATPPMPSLDEYRALAARSWSDSPIREDARFRHAVGGSGFSPHPAADAAWMIEALGAIDSNSRVAEELRELSSGAIRAVSPGSVLDANVSHLRSTVAPLVFDRVDEAIDVARQRARSQLARFDESGAAIYPRPKQGPDFARTNPNREASGYAGLIVLEALRAASFSGDRELLDQAVRALKNLERFRDGVPRGAQTWECPLHTPDILASAHLAHAYTIAYQLTGDPEMLELARYWAWTGVPFVYLVNPTEGKVGNYATIAVLGATTWIAPVWIGRPVQWCGMVYADALNELARVDHEGPWGTLARGITASAIQQSYPIDDPHRGLLPDSFVLASQTRVGPDINPGTVQPLAMRFLTGQPPYAMRSARRSGAWIHAPGELEILEDSPGKLRFRVIGWSVKPYRVLVNGLKNAPKLSVDGVPAAIGETQRFRHDPGSLLIRLEGTATVAIEMR